MRSTWWATPLTRAALAGPATANGTVAQGGLSTAWAIRRSSRAGSCCTSSRLIQPFSPRTAAQASLARQAAQRQPCSAASGLLRQMPPAACTVFRSPRMYTRHDKHCANTNVSPRTAHAHAQGGPLRNEPWVVRLGTDGTCTDDASLGGRGALRCRTTTTAVDTYTTIWVRTLHVDLSCERR